MSDFGVQCSGDFGVGQLVEPSLAIVTGSFEIEVRPQSLWLVFRGGNLDPIAMKILVGGELIDPAA